MATENTIVLSNVTLLQISSVVFAEMLDIWLETVLIVNVEQTIAMTTADLDPDAQLDASVMLLTVNMSPSCKNCLAVAPALDHNTGSRQDRAAMIAVVLAAMVGVEAVRMFHHGSVAQLVQQHHGHVTVRSVMVPPVLLLRGLPFLPFCSASAEVSSGSLVPAS